MNHREYAKLHGIDTSKTDIAFELAHLVTVARIHAGVTQKELADLMGTHQSVVSRAESGTIPPNIPFLVKMAEAVGAELVLPKLKFK